MKFAVNLWSYPPELPLFEALEHAKRVGYEGFEVAVDEKDLEEFSESKWQSIRKKAEEIGISIPSVSTGLFWKYNLFTDPQTALKVMECECKAAQIVGAEVVLVVPGLGVSELGYEEHFSKAAEILKQGAAVARRYGVKIGIENVWNRIFAGPLDFQRLMKELTGTDIGVYFDVGNTLPHSLPEHWIQLLGKHILQVHVKDYYISAGGLNRGFGIPLNGDVNWPAVKRALKEINYQGFVVPEVPPYPGDPFKAAEDALSSLKKIFG